MRFIFRNLLITSAVLMAGLAFCTLNPQTAEWHDLLRLALQAMHSKGMQEIFAIGFLTSCGFDLVMSSGYAVSLPSFHSQSHSVMQVMKASDE